MPQKPKPRTSKSKKSATARAQSRKMSDSERLFIKENDGFILEVSGSTVSPPSTWVSHRRSKNYIARIIGFDTKYGFAREFVENHGTLAEPIFSKNDFKEGEIYEFVNIYYTSSGKERVQRSGLYLCKFVRDDAIGFIPISKEEAKKLLSEKFEAQKVIEIDLNEDVESIKEKARLLAGVLSKKTLDLKKMAQKLYDQLAKLEEVLKKIEDLDRAMKEKEALAKLISSSDLVEASKEMRKKLSDDIKGVAERIVGLWGGNKYEYSLAVVDPETKRKHRVIIKLKDGNIYYVKVDDEYVWATFKEDIPLGKVVSGIHIMKLALEQTIKTIKENLDKARQELLDEETIRKIDSIIEERKKLRNEILNELKKEAKGLALALGQKKGSAYKLESPELTIKVSGGEVEYIKYLGEYIYGYGKEGTLDKLMSALQAIRKKLKEAPAK